MKRVHVPLSISMKGFSGKLPNVMCLSLLDQLLSHINISSEERDSQIMVMPAFISSVNKRQSDS